MADWCALPEGVVGLIASRLPLIEDFIAFRATCSSWLKGTSWKETSCDKLPLLMLSSILKEHPADEREFLSLSRGKKTYNISLPEAFGMECIGSKGWLIKVEHSTGNMCLSHPITRGHIPLPKVVPKVNILLQPREFISVALSASPYETSDFTVMVAYEDGSYISGRYMGYWKPGNETWTTVEIPQCVEDWNYYNGKFYALTLGAQIWMCDVSGPKPNNKASKITALPWGFSRLKAQLVECEGRLLVVAPFVCHHPSGMGYYEHDLEMVEIDVVKGSYSIITSLGSSTVFLGRNEGFSIDANRFPGIIEPNSIYFGDGSHKVATPGPNHISKPNYDSGVWFNI